MPRCVPVLLALQLGLVYFFAGLAKLDADWLLRAQPLATWLTRYGDVPAIGPLLSLPGVAHGLAWSGALFDLSVAFLLCGRRTRLPAYALLVLFHGATGLLFPIGLFPWLMIALTPVFFAPTWPRALFARLLAVPSRRRDRRSLRGRSAPYPLRPSRSTSRCSCCCRCATCSIPAP